jgi:hypothetical protein
MPRLLAALMVLCAVLAIACSGDDDAVVTPSNAAVSSTLLPVGGSSATLQTRFSHLDSPSMPSGR